jgi:hypothetical protein
MLETPLMPAEAEPIASAVDAWLADFERALAAAGADVLQHLFHQDSYWRDVLALTWGIRTVHGSDMIVDKLWRHAGRVRPRGFRTDPLRTPPRRVMRAGTDAIEAIFRFETTVGEASGVVRLTPDPADPGR